MQSIVGKLSSPHQTKSNQSSTGVNRGKSDLGGAWRKHAYGTFLPSSRVLSDKRFNDRRLAAMAIPGRASASSSQRREGTQLVRSKRLVHNACHRGEKTHGLSDPSAWYIMHVALSSVSVQGSYTRINYFIAQTLLMIAEHHMVKALTRMRALHTS